ncbi:MAG: MarR family transcriptional regulator [Armatimonadota bacterium]
MPMRKPTDPIEEALDVAREAFIEEWGRMSTSWGINRTMAHIHALLFITGEPMTMDQIIERLKISRGSASTNLRQLMDWGVVRRYRPPGKRRDLYVADVDAVTMVARVVRERKRRELDPTVAALRHCSQIAPPPGEDERTDTFHRRVNELLEVFAMVDFASEFALGSDRRAAWLMANAKHLRRLLENLTPPGED